MSEPRRRANWHLIISRIGRRAIELVASIAHRRTKHHINTRIQSRLPWNFGQIPSCSTSWTRTHTPIIRVSHPNLVWLGKVCRGAVVILTRWVGIERLAFAETNLSTTAAKFDSRLARLVVLQRQRQQTRSLLGGPRNGDVIVGMEGVGLSRLPVRGAWASIQIDRSRGRNGVVPAKRGGCRHLEEKVRRRKLSIVEHYYLV
jgi:hypothetical protein